MTVRVGLNFTFEFESVHEFFIKLNFVFSKSMNLNFVIVSKLMNLIFTFSKSMNLNLNLNFVFSKSINLNILI